MTPKQFWTQLALKVVGFLIIAALVLAFIAVIAKPKLCETVQTHENRSVTVCR